MATWQSTVPRAMASLQALLPSASKVYDLIVNPDALSLFVGLLLFFIVFTIFECRALMRELREDRRNARRQQNKAE